MKKSMMLIGAMLMASCFTANATSEQSGKVIGSGTIHFSGAVVADQCSFTGKALLVESTCFNPSLGKSEVKTIDLEKVLKSGKQVDGEGYTLNAIKLKDKIYRIDVSYL